MLSGQYSIFTQKSITGLARAGVGLPGLLLYIMYVTYTQSTGYHLATIQVCQLCNYLPRKKIPKKEFKHPKGVTARFGFLPIRIAFSLPYRVLSQENIPVAFPHMRR